MFEGGDDKPEEVMPWKDSKNLEEMDKADTFFDNCILFLSVQAMVVYVFYAFKFSGFDPFSANILGGAISFVADIWTDVYLWYYS